MIERTQAELDVMVRSVMHLVEGYAERHARGWKQSYLKDLRAIGQEVAFQIARKFDPAVGAPFAAIIAKQVPYAMIKFLTREKRERDAMNEAMQRAHYESVAPPVRTSKPGWGATPKEMTAHAVREARLLAQRLAAAALVATDAPIDPQEILLEREEIQHAVDTMNRVLASFTSQQRDAFRLHHIQGVEQKEVAARLGVSERTVQRHLHRVEVGLREGLVEAGIESREHVRAAWYVLTQSGEGDGEPSEARASPPTEAPATD